MSKWTQQNIELLTKLWNEGLSAKEIGAQIGVSNDAVTSKARHLGLPRRPNPAGPRISEFAEELANNGGNVELAGKAIGVNFALAQDMFQRICKAQGPQALGKWHIPWPK